MTSRVTKLIQALNLVHRWAAHWICPVCGYRVRSPLRAGYMALEVLIEDHEERRHGIEPVLPFSVCLKDNRITVSYL